MARPKGSKNRPGSMKPGPRKGFTKFELPEKFSASQILKIKEAIIELIESEEADNLSEAADIIGVPKLRVHNWFATDKEWANYVKLAQEIQADRLEAKLDDMKHPVALIFRLKKLRPEYRDSHKFDVSSEGLERLLSELRELGKNKEDKPAEPPVPVLDEAESILNESKD